MVARGRASVQAGQAKLTLFASPLFLGGSGAENRSSGQICLSWKTFKTGQAWQHHAG